VIRSSSLHLACRVCVLFLFFFNDTAPPEIYTLSLHDALPISGEAQDRGPAGGGRPRDESPQGGSEPRVRGLAPGDRRARDAGPRSEEHTSELQSLTNLVCRLLLEKKKNKNNLTLLYVGERTAH